MIKQLDTFAFPSPINPAEEGKWFIVVTSFEATTAISGITDENNSFSITIPSHWTLKDSGEIITEINELLELYLKLIWNYM